MSAEVPGYDALIARIAKVERENRRMKRAALVTLLLPVAFLVMAHAQTNKVVVPQPQTNGIVATQAPANKVAVAQPQANRVVVANEFVLRDAAGHTRARLWFGPKPTKSPAAAFLTFYDSAGEHDLATLAANGADRSANLNLGGLIASTPALALTANAKGTYASFGTAGNKPRGIQLSAEPEKSNISLSGPEDLLKSAINLTGTAEGGEVYVNDAQGAAGVALLTKEKDGMSIKDREGRTVLLLGDHLSFGDSQNNLPAVLYGGKDGPFLNLADAQGFSVQLGVSKTIAKATGQRLTSKAASLRMFDDKGNIIWSAP